MFRMLIIAFCVLAVAGCTRLERNTPLAIAQCGVEVGATCVNGLMGWSSRNAEGATERWAQGCKVSQNDFCSWCAASGDPIFYPKGTRPKPSDCAGTRPRK